MVYARQQHRIMQAVQTLEQRSGAMLIQQHGLDGQGTSLADIGRARGVTGTAKSSHVQPSSEGIPSFRP